MSRISFCCGLVLAMSLAGTVLRAEPPDANASPASKELAVQLALQQAKDDLKRGETKLAVEVLESKLAWINGNRDYLATLREAYSVHLKELQRNRQDAEIPAVLAKLRLYDPSAQLPGYPPEPKPPPPVTSSPPAQREPPKPAASDDSDPFQQTPVAQGPNASELLRRAEIAFSRDRFLEAEDLFAKAHAQDPNAADSSNAHWGYCRLYRVAQELNRNPNADPALLSAWEQETAEALAMARDNAELSRFAHKVLEQVHVRQSGKGAVTPVSAQVRAPNSGWNTQESANFRLVHQQTNEFAARLLQMAEENRRRLFERWYGPNPQGWSPRCEIYLHATGPEYAKATGKLPQAPGHSTIEVQAGKVVRRRIDLVANHPNLLGGNLPHELMHIILADLFPQPLLPRWADEALAVLAEPRENVQRYLRLLPQLRQEAKLFSVGQLLSMPEFPDPSRITAFYAESVSLVDMLVAERGEKEFLIFLRDAQRYGYEKALERNYNLRGYNDLQKHWLSKTGG
ncbi:MAG TPA: hypothetical protein VGZ47_17110 [Gemmataceae bacterium]|jgi:tetratricopeptide (TPR) repeat protein|nr:hypothetical protein [Gemmataceae bacterium]